MFYLKEVLFRIQYTSMSFAIILIICYNSRDFLFFLLTFNFLSSNHDSSFSPSGIEYLIYTHPSELFSTYLVIVFYFTFMISFYHFFWNILDFAKPSLKRSDFVLLNKGTIRITATFLLLNIFFLLFLLPSCWSFFESFNETSDSDAALKFFFELKVKDYISFFKNLLYTTNVGLILIFFLWFFMNRQRLRELLNWKKLYLFFNFVFATICAPSDVLSQMTNIVMLTFFVELTILLRISKLKLEKQIKYSIIKRVIPNDLNDKASLKCNHFLNRISL